MTEEDLIQTDRFGDRLRAACRNMGVTLRTCPASSGETKDDHIFWGPQLNIGLCPMERSIYARADVLDKGQPIRGALGVLHELGHLVFWGPQFGLDTQEEWFIPWEEAVFRWASDGDAALYWSDAYTKLTAITADGFSGAKEVGEWRRPQRSGWFRSASSLCRRLGVLTRCGEPTWEAPDWSRLPSYFAAP